MLLNGILAWDACKDASDSGRRLSISLNDAYWEDRLIGAFDACGCSSACLLYCLSSLISFNTRFTLAFGRRLSGVERVSLLTPSSIDPVPE